MSAFSFLTALRKDATAADVHISSTGGKPRKAKPFKAIIGTISPNTKLPVTGATMAAQEETGQTGSKTAAWSIPFTVAKADVDQQLIFGWASVVEKDGQLVIDKQGDAITPADLEAAAYDFVLHARQHGDMHKAASTGRMVESMVFTKQKQQALGIDLGKVGWWAGFKIDAPEVWAAHKRGERPEFSIGGTGRRTEL